MVLSGVRENCIFSRDSLTNIIGSKNVDVISECSRHVVTGFEGDDIFLVNDDVLDYSLERMQEFLILIMIARCYC